MTTANGLVSVPGGRLDDRVLVALEETQRRVPFSGLRRTLGAHPESLSRALHRLEREGLVERSSEGYRSTRHLEPPAFPAEDVHPVAQVDLPSGVTPDSVLERLRGRWFGHLRWMGVVERPEGPLLSWTRRDGTGSVLLGVRGRVAQIYSTGDSATSDAGESEEAAYELLVAVADVLRPPAPRSHVAFLAAGGPVAGPRGALGPRPENN